LAGNDSKISDAERAAEERWRIAPRLLSRERVAAYVGLSPNAFEAEVAAGTFPGPFPLRRARRLLRDIRALDAAIGPVIRDHDR
jgi:hypothetical protein